jgi:hypothetical protein
LILFRYLKKNLILNGALSSDIQLECKTISLDFIIDDWIKMYKYLFISLFFCILYVFLIFYLSSIYQVDLMVRLNVSAMILCLGIYKIIDKIIKEKNKFLYKFLDSVVIGFVYGACFIAIIHLSF